MVNLQVHDAVSYQPCHYHISINSHRGYMLKISSASYAQVYSLGMTRCHTDTLVREDRGTYEAYTHCPRSGHFAWKCAQHSTQTRLQGSMCLLDTINITNDHKAHCTGLTFTYWTCYADQVEQFMQCIAPANEAMASARKNMAEVFRYHIGELLADFLSCGDTVTVLCYCGTLNRLQKAICFNRPELLHQCHHLAQ